MSENKFAHTPRPWHWDGSGPVSYDKEQEAPWLVDSDDKPILKGEIVCTSEANARLIASAPDLLEALEYVLNHPIVRITGDVEIMIKNAIAKARGQS